MFKNLFVLYMKFTSYIVVVARNFYPAVKFNLGVEHRGQILPGVCFISPAT